MGARGEAEITLSSALSRQRTGCWVVKEWKKPGSVTKHQANRGYVSVHDLTWDFLGEDEGGGKGGREGEGGMEGVWMDTDEG